MIQQFISNVLTTQQQRHSTDISGYVNIRSCLKLHKNNKQVTVNHINTKNNSSSAMLTATDQKQKNINRWHYSPTHRLNVNVMLS